MFTTLRFPREALLLFVFLTVLPINAQESPEPPLVVEELMEPEVPEISEDNVEVPEPPEDDVPEIGPVPEEALAEDQVAVGVEDELPADELFPLAESELLDESAVLPLDQAGLEPGTYVAPEEYEVDTETGMITAIENVDEDPVEDPEDGFASFALPLALTTNPGIAPGGFSYVLGGRPSGFSGNPRSSPIGAFRQGLTLTADFFTAYNSNVTQASGDVGSPVNDDLIFSIGGTVSYLTQSRDWNFGAKYTGFYDIYADNTDFNGINQSAEILANYDGGKLSASFFTGISQERGANRFLGSDNFVEQTSISVGASSAYQLGAKTSVQADLIYRFTTSDGGDFEDTNFIGGGLSALWKFSPITEIGPGIRYTFESNSGNARTAFGPTLNVNYRLSSKLSLSSRVGLDFIDFSNDGSSDPSTSALVAVKWDASRLWGMDLTLYRDTEADPSLAGAFNEVTAIRVGYTRRISRATASLGIGYEMAQTAGNDSGGAGVSRPDRDFLTLDAAVGMKLFRDTTEARVFVRYSDQSGGAGESFDSTLVGFSLSRTF